jgi:protein TonB
MFNDFDGSAKDEEKGRGRMGLSLALSALLYGVLAALLVSVVATARAVVREREVEVEFASLPPAPAAPEPEAAPPPPPPPPAPRPRGSRRPAAQRGSMATPGAIPDGRPEESDGNLVEAGAVGPVDGFTDGGGGGEPEPPPPAPPAPPPPPPPVSPRQERIEVRRPEFLSGCRSPEVPAAVQRQAATIRILVQMLIMPDGKPGSIRVLEGHPLVPDASIIACARDQRFEPARLADGTAVPYPFRRRYVFRPSNL